MQNLEKGMVLKDNLFGMKWEVLDEKIRKVKNVDNGMIINIEEEKLNNFIVVSTPVKKETKEDKKIINYALKDGIIINADTKEPICNQGELRFSAISTVYTKNKGFILVGYKVNAGCYSYDYVVYRYWFNKDKFEKIETNEYFPFDRMRTILSTKKYYISCETNTGTYGDYRSAFFYVFDKKFNLLAKSSFPYIAKVPIVLSDKGDTVSAFTLTSRSIGAFSSPNAEIAFLEISKNGVEIINRKFLNLGGSSYNTWSINNKNNKVCNVSFLKKGSKLCVYNGSNIGIYNLKDYTMIDSFPLRANLKLEFVEIYDTYIEDFSITKNSISIHFRGENAITTTRAILNVKKTSDRGYVQNVA